MKDYDELIESWISGNCSDMTDEAMKMKRSEVVNLTLELSQRVGKKDAEMLARMLQVREYKGK